MAIQDRQLEDVRAVVAPMARAAEALQDDAAAERLVHAVHSGDQAEISRLFEGMGARGVASRRGTASVPLSKGVTRQVLAYDPNERFHIEIIIDFDPK